MFVTVVSMQKRDQLALDCYIFDFLLSKKKLHFL